MLSRVVPQPELLSAPRSFPAEKQELARATCAATTDGRA